MLDVGTRKFPRFESNIMMFFRPIKKTNGYIVGRIRNLSSAGISIESENYDIKPKEDLEFKLKHSSRDSLLVKGKVVWNEKSELASVAGIKLKKLDKATRKKMLEIVPVTGNIPDDSFNYDKDKKSVVAEREDIESKKKSVAFTSFGISKIKVNFNEVSNNDEFELMGKFVLCGGNKCIDPITDDVTVNVGTSSIIIPSPNSFVEETVGKFKFNGTINGADVKMEIEEVDLDTFNFIIKAKGVDLTGICNSVDVKLIIGNDEGQSNIRLKGMLEVEDKEKAEILSVTGNIPDDSFHYGKDKESVVTENEDIKSEEKSSFSENNNNFNKRKLNWLFGVLVIVALIGIGYTTLAVFKSSKLEKSLNMQEKQLIDIRVKLIKLMENNVSLNESVGNLYPMQQSGTLDTERREEFLVKIEQIEQQLKHGLSNITKFEQDLAHKFEAYTKQQGDILFGASISSNVKADTKKKQASSTPKEVPNESKKLLSENEKLNDENKRLKNELQRVYRFL